MPAASFSTPPQPPEGGAEDIAGHLPNFLLEKENPEEYFLCHYSLFEDNFLEELDTKLQNIMDNSVNQTILTATRTLFVYIATTDSQKHRNDIQNAMAAFNACILWECCANGIDHVLLSSRFHTITKTSLSYAFYNGRYCKRIPIPSTKKIVPKEDSNTIQWHLWNHSREMNRISWIINVAQLLTEFAEDLNACPILGEYAPSKGHDNLSRIINNLDKATVTILATTSCINFTVKPTTEDTQFPEVYPYVQLATLETLEEGYNVYQEDVDLLLDLVHSTSLEGQKALKAHSWFTNFLAHTLTINNPSYYC
jgi:hypothetical protein